MTPLRLFAIVLILGAATFAWFTLGASVVHRTGESDYQLQQEVMSLWGGPHAQVAPDAWYEEERTVTDEVETVDATGRQVTRTVHRMVVERFPVMLDRSRVAVDLKLAHRRKGLLWYATYGVAVEGAYRLTNTTAAPRDVKLHVAFPSEQAIYDGFRFEVDSVAAPPVTDMSAGVVHTVRLEPGEGADLLLAYRSRGLDRWDYAFAPGGVAQVKDFELTMTTDFDGIDFPAGTVSPSHKARTPSGWKLDWTFSSLVTGQRVGMALPNKLNPGPLAARITFFAPISLLFFVTVMVILGVLRDESLHPMNYAFVAAAFFAFHLLLAYLADHVNIHAAFAISAATSIGLVVSYLRLVAGMRFAVLRAGAAQLVFLVLFGYAFFFEGYTGLTVTVGSILTLFVLMQLTGRVDWSAVFARGPRSEPVRA